MYQNKNFIFFQNHFHFQLEMDGSDHFHFRFHFHFQVEMVWKWKWFWKWKWKFQGVDLVPWRNSKGGRKYAKSTQVAEPVRSALLFPSMVASIKTLKF